MGQPTRANAIRPYIKTHFGHTHIKQVAPDVLGHRVITTYEAEAENVTSADIVQRILDYADVP